MEPSEESICCKQTDKNRDMIYKALLDPVFRKRLKRDPAAALGVAEISKENLAEVRMVLAAVKGIENQIASIADELLCANGGGCGIA